MTPQDAYGVCAAIVAAFSFGTFGVPIRQTKHIPVHAFIFRTYLTITVWACSNVVRVSLIAHHLTNDEISDSHTHQEMISENTQESQAIPWGLISGFLWVLGGTCGVYAIRMAGMAVAVGTWSSIMVFMNFFWGILIFNEPVADFSSTVAAFAMLAAGLLGMSKYSAPTRSLQDENDRIEECAEKVDSEGDFMEVESPLQVALVERTNQRDPSFSQPRPFLEMAPSTSTLLQRDETRVLLATMNQNGELQTSATESLPDNASYDDLTKKTREGIIEMEDIFGLPIHLSVTKRTAGVMAAVLNGFLSGSSLIPVHYAKNQRNYDGTIGAFEYFCSMASGALVANSILYGCWFILRYEDSMSSTIRNMPRFYVKEILFPGLLGGLFLAVGMSAAVSAVAMVGQSVGNSIVQSKILISGLWGILWFNEIPKPAIGKWFLSACVSVIGIFWLSRERLLAVQQNVSSSK